jgi:mRNA interferase YafQ
MRQIERTAQFRRDFKRELKGRRGRELEMALTSIVGMLMDDQPLPARCRDHPLSGEWAGFRDCHVRPDLVLIYEKPDEATLRLVRLGSHSDLGW